ncbi:hypothetical protein FDP41_008804 [Naegleria fowleri]|uniref:F-box domain-containing protein n=1 Tax=Naegleria fowleri TaxID=5763 RepID=A0A6A5BDP1_NAEFO|nr:uncharacterized protein FDP41_008804 [Naegleria fowleri]KAF0972952.1 hypothetical protein FDP41_008804 [Naegleria fowleri]
MTFLLSIGTAPRSFSPKHKCKNECCHQHQLSGDVIAFGVAPFLNQSDYIRLAGVCAEWRKALLMTTTKASTGLHPCLERVYSNRLRREKFLKKTKGKHDIFQLFSKFEFRDCHLTRAHFKTMFYAETISSIQLCHTNFVSSSIPPNHVDLKTLKDLHLINIGLSMNDIRNMMQGLFHFKKLTLTNNGLDHRGISLLLKAIIPILNH